MGAVVLPLDSVIVGDQCKRNNWRDRECGPPLER